MKGLQNLVLRFIFMRESVSCLVKLNKTWQYCKSSDSFLFVCAKLQEAQEVLSCLQARLLLKRCDTNAASLKAAGCHCLSFRIDLEIPQDRCHRLWGRVRKSQTSRAGSHRLKSVCAINSWLCLQQPAWRGKKCVLFVRGVGRFFLCRNLTHQAASYLHLWRTD